VKRTVHSPCILEAFCRHKRALPLRERCTMEGDNVMNMTNTAADEALEGVGTRRSEASGRGGRRH
jgi:hypothetical protein